MTARERGLLGLREDDDFHPAIPCVLVEAAPGVTRIDQPEGGEHAGNGALLVHEAEDGLHVTWALLQLVGYTEGDPPAEWRYQVIAWGCGPSGSLREPRHTYFGEEGYVFYVDPGLLAWAFESLGRWFDWG